MNKQPKAWAESMLVAYVDNQLEPAQMATVEQAMRDDPEARAIVGMLRRSGAAVRSAFDQPMEEPVPARLLSIVGSPGRGTGRGKLVPFWRWFGESARRHTLLAMAASLAGLMIGFGAGFLQFSPADTIRPAGAAASGEFEAALYQALESGAAGPGAIYSDTAAGTTGKVLVTGDVPTALGDLCREFRHDWSDAQGNRTSHGIACLSDDGEWSVLTMPPRPAM
jgi:anti-sigma factor RsiW